MSFQEIDIDRIESNQENPRKVFDEQKIEELALSISNKGLLVPITVYPKNKNMFVLLDGERRWRAAKKINLSKIPAWVQDKPNPVENLSKMFHIHKEREEWNNADAVRALEKLIEVSREKDPVKLEGLTGIKPETIIDWMRIIEQPQNYRQLIYDGSLPFNFFTELHNRVIIPLKNDRPSIFEEAGKEKGVISLFIQRRQAGNLENMTGDLRMMTTIIRKAKEDEGKTGQSPHDKILKKVIKDKEYLVEDAYEEVTGATVATQKIVKQCGRFNERFKTISAENLTSQEKRSLFKALKKLVQTIRSLLVKLR